jgi:hypothetical protein
MAPIRTRNSTIEYVEKSSTAMRIKKYGIPQARPAARKSQRALRDMFTSLGPKNYRVLRCSHKRTKGENPNRILYCFFLWLKPLGKVLVEKDEPLVRALLTCAKTVCPIPVF